MTLLCHEGIWVYYKIVQTTGQEEKGRARQKRRTRALLLRSAVDLIQRGEVPTVTSVADAADVSRRTAYRYFPTQEQLLAEASLESLRPRVEAIIGAARRELEELLASRRYLWLDFLTYPGRLCAADEAIAVELESLDVEHSHALGAKQVRAQLWWTER
jgi:AcrR family transcriptional regulator